jgi:hypothetical protein
VRGRLPQQELQRPAIAVCHTFPDCYLLPKDTNGMDVPVRQQVQQQQQRNHYQQPLGEECSSSSQQQKRTEAVKLLSSSGSWVTMLHKVKPTRLQAMFWTRHTK